MDSITRERFRNAADKIRITYTTEAENLYHPREISIIYTFNRRLTNYKNEPEKTKERFCEIT